MSNLGMGVHITPPFFEREDIFLSTIPTRRLIAVLWGRFLKWLTDPKEHW